MSGKVFFDTTILIYAVSEDQSRSAASGILLNAGGHLSVQVLNEFVNVARKKLKLSWPEINKALRAVRNLCGPPFPLTVETHERALQIAELRNYNFYDCLIIAAALHAGCDLLYSEDMQHNQKIESLTIRNPFLGVTSSQPSRQRSKPIQ